MANSDQHNQQTIPRVILGKGGSIKDGQQLHFANDSPYSKLLITLVQRAGAPVHKIGDRPTGLLAEV